MQKEFFISILLSIIVTVSSQKLLSQTGDISTPVSQTKEATATLFGSDIVLNDEPDQDQRNVTICQAFNGWMYAAYWYPKDAICQIVILKSVDQGSTWTIFKEAWTGFAYESIECLDVEVCGNSTENLKLFLGILRFSQNYNEGNGYVLRYNAVTGDFEQEVMQDGSNYIRDLCLATDHGFQASGSNPGSIAILYNDEEFWGNDVLICRVSVDGGTTFQSNQVHSTPTNVDITKVSLSYGASNSYPEGYYFVSWQEGLSITPAHGNIFVAHSIDGPLSAFSSPLCLDSLDINITSKCRNPVIACQYGPTENDSSDFTTVIIYEHQNLSGNGYTMKGFFARESVGSSDFTPFEFADGLTQKRQAGLAYNPIDSNFLLTYFDSTNMKLPLLSNNFNLDNPDVWTQISSGYNDVPVSISPYPEVMFNNTDGSSVTVWIGDGNNGNRIALFDALYNTYTYLDGLSIISTQLYHKAYPNPCISTVNIEFELPQECRVELNLYNSIQRCVVNFSVNTLQKGKHVFPISIQTLDPGLYTYTINCSGNLVAGKIIIIE